MPTLLEVGQYRFFMVMFDCIERPRIHVRGGSIGEAKFWLAPTVELATAWGTLPANLRAAGSSSRATLRS